MISTWGASRGTPTPPAPGWSPGIIVAGNNVFGWGFAKAPIVSADLGYVVEEPYTESELISFFEAPDDSRVIVCFSGDIAEELDGYTFDVNGTKLAVMTPAEYSEANDWTLMFLESHWMISGQAYVITRVPV